MLHALGKFSLCLNNKGSCRDAVDSVFLPLGHLTPLKRDKQVGAHLIIMLAAQLKYTAGEPPPKPVALWHRSC